MKWRWLLLYAAAVLLTSAGSCRHVDDGDAALHLVLRWGPVSWWDVALLRARRELAEARDAAKREELALAKLRARLPADVHIVDVELEPAGDA